MKKIWILCISILLFTLLIAGCGGENENGNEKNDQLEEENNTSEQENEPVQDGEENDEQKLYHEVGETFEFIGESPALPIEITVNKIWMEDGAQHEQHIEEHVISPAEKDTVTFIDYTVTNKGDETLPFNDVIPRYFGEDATLDEIDLFYPENDLVKDYADAYQLELEPGESMDITGSVITSIYSENGGAFVWKFMDETPEVVFQTPQEERNDKMGIYDLGEKIYVVDQTDERQLIVTIEDIDVVDGEEGFDSLIEDPVYIKLKMNIENAGSEQQEIPSVFPDPVIDGEGQQHTTEFKKEGNLIDDPWNDPERIIEPGEQFTGELYIGVLEEIVDDVQLYYFDGSFLTYPEYSKIINYHLE